MNSQYPLVSICIPTYNGEKYLSEALLSALNQTYSNIEIILSDDNSNDNTLSIAKSFKEKSSYPFYIMNHVPSGIGSNWNNCIENANGTYIKFLFQDDFLAPDCVEKMVSAVVEDNRIGLLFCKRKIVTDTNTLDNSWYKNWIVTFENLHLSWSNPIKKIQSGRKLLKDPSFFSKPLNKIGEPICTLLHKEKFKQAGLFDTELKQMLDHEAWYRLMKNSYVGFIDEELVSFRLHVHQTSFKNKVGLLNEKELYKKKIFSNLFYLLDFKVATNLFKDIYIFRSGKILNFYNGTKGFLRNLGLLRLLNNKPNKSVELISIHIPKTAGTSFGKILEKNYKNNLLKVYRGLIHNEFKNGRPINVNHSIKVIHGHFPYHINLRKKYPNAKIVTWVRHPVDRLISHYNFLRNYPKHGNIAHDILLDNQLGIIDFVKNPDCSSEVFVYKEYLQYFQQIKFEDFFFIGLTKQYEDHLKILSEKLGWQFSDVYSERKSQTIDSLTESEINQLKELLEEEITFYNLIQEKVENILV